MNNSIYGDNQISIHKERMNFKLSLRKQRLKEDVKRIKSINMLLNDNSNTYIDNNISQDNNNTSLISLLTKNYLEDDINAIDILLLINNIFEFYIQFSSSIDNNTHKNHSFVLNKTRESFINDFTLIKNSLVNENEEESDKNDFTITFLRKISTIIKCYNFFQRVFRTINNHINDYSSIKDILISLISGKVYIINLFICYFNRLESATNNKNNNNTNIEFHNKYDQIVNSHSEFFVNIVKDLILVVDELSVIFHSHYNNNENNNEKDLINIIIKKDFYNKIQLSSCYTELIQFLVLNSLRFIELTLETKSDNSYYTLLKYLIDKLTFAFTKELPFYQLLENFMLFLQYTTSNLARNMNNSYSDDGEKESDDKVSIEYTNSLVLFYSDLSDSIMSLKDYFININKNSIISTIYRDYLLESFFSILSSSYELFNSMTIFINKNTSNGNNFISQVITIGVNLFTYIRNDSNNLIEFMYKNIINSNYNDFNFITKYLDYYSSIYSNKFDQNGINIIEVLFVFDSINANSISLNNIDNINNANSNDKNSYYNYSNISIIDAIHILMKESNCYSYKIKNRKKECYTDLLEKAIELSSSIIKSYIICLENNNKIENYYKKYELIINLFNEKLNNNINQNSICNNLINNIYCPLLNQNFLSFINLEFSQIINIIISNSLKNKSIISDKCAMSRIKSNIFLISISVLQIIQQLNKITNYSMLSNDYLIKSQNYNNSLNNSISSNDIIIKQSHLIQNLLKFVKELPYIAKVDFGKCLIKSISSYLLELLNHLSINNCFYLVKDFFTLAVIKMIVGFMRNTFNIEIISSCLGIFNILVYLAVNSNDVFYIKKLVDADCYEATLHVKNYYANKHSNISNLEYMDDDKDSNIGFKLIECLSDGIISKIDTIFGNSNSQKVDINTIMEIDN